MPRNFQLAPLFPGLKSCRALCLTIFLWLSSSLSFGEVLVVPNSNSDQPGPGVLNLFSPGNFSRSLTVYNSSQFQEAMPAGALITEIAYRIDEQDRTAFSASISGIEIRMSASPSLAPELPLPFATSIGSDEKVVFPRGSIEFTAEPTESGANPFSLRIRLQDPFFYNPGKGGLALDLRNYGSASSTVLLDAGNEEALSIQGNLNDANAIRLAAAPILQLTFLPVPEPSAFALIAFGAILTLSVRRLTNGSASSLL